ncbi:MAG: aldose 1-epimerase family protein, partial [Clostridia bacterium]|nr:aldose 1-epimerase family protein [Clostridia bacterium]
MVRISNNILSAEFNEFGAELKSLKKGKEEYIYGGDSKFWNGSSPVLFPICSALKDDTYYIDGKKYKMDKHGFAKNMLFSVEEKSENQVTFLLVDNADTLKIYPYKFEFRIRYTLRENKLDVEYIIKNTNDNEMFFSVGAHEGYSCPEGIEDYDILLPSKQTLKSNILSGPDTLGYEQMEILNDNNIFPLKNEYFKDDALIFLNIPFDNLILENRNTKKAIKITFKDFPYLLIWTKPFAPYICVEPWCGITDRLGTNQD